MSITIPPASDDQRRVALDRANEIRCDRARLKRDLKGGRRNVIEVMIEPPECALTMRIIDLLIAAPRLGRVKANKALSRAAISPSKTVGSLTERQRVELAYIVHRKGWCG
jgi:hypothetical protein